MQALSNLKMKINSEKIKKINDVNKLDLFERKEKLKQILKNEKLSKEELEDLLLLDNTNEDLLYRYILLLDKSSADSAIRKYSDYISPDKIDDLSRTIFCRTSNEMGYRDITNKKIFFDSLACLLDKKTKDDFKNKIDILATKTKSIMINNQPFDTFNLEALYLYFCVMIYEKNKLMEKNNQLNKYLKNLELLLLSLNDFQHYRTKNDFTLEKKDIKRFLTLIFSILNLESDNYSEIFQASLVLNKPKENVIEISLKVLENRLILFIGESETEQFMKKINRSQINQSLNFSKSENGVKLNEESFLYEYIIENNVYKKYESQILELLEVIFSSDLFKSLFEALFNNEERNMKYNFDDGKKAIKHLWNDVIFFYHLNLKEYQVSLTENFSRFFSQFIS